MTPEVKAIVLTLIVAMLVVGIFIAGAEVLNANACPEGCHPCVAGCSQSIRGCCADGCVSEAPGDFHCFCDEEGAP